MRTRQMQGIGHDPEFDECRDQMLNLNGQLSRALTGQCFIPTLKLTAKKREGDVNAKHPEGQNPPNQTKLNKNQKTMELTANFGIKTVRILQRGRSRRGPQQSCFLGTALYS